MLTTSEVVRLGDAEFKWGKKRGTGGKKKEVQFYESFTYDSVEYTLYDCVYMHKEGDSEPYIGKLIKIWENPNKSQKIKVQWFFRPSEIVYWLRYHNVDALENEIFFASGEGIGLTNVNPLEAIAGKCNVVCISKDSRNPQPSSEELNMADYVFYRTLDVGSCTILDNMGDKIGGLEVKFVFNREENVKFSGPKLVSKQKKDDSRMDVLSEGTSQILGDVAPEMLQIVKVDANHDLLVEKEDSGSRTVNDSRLANYSRLAVNHLEAEESSLENRPQKRAKLDSSFKLNKAKDAFLVEKSTAIGNDAKPAIPSVIAPEEKTKIGHSEEIVGLAKNKKLPKELSTLDDLPSKKRRIQESVKLSNNNCRNSTVVAGSSAQDMSKSVEDSLGLADGPLEDKPKGQPNRFAKCSNNLDKIPSQEMPKDGHDKPTTSLERSPPNETLDRVTSKSMGLGKGPSNEKPNEKRWKHMKTSFGMDQMAPQKKIGTKKSMLQNKDLAKVSEPSIIANEIIEGRIIEVTRKPDVDKGKWFRSLPWEEMMQTAHEQRTLVLLQNLDPKCTSSEVEDIVWHAFKEKCTAKMVQRLASSSPHYGQALVIFKTKEAAEKVIKKLEVGCLIVSNQRPVVGCIAVLPKIARKQSTFVGHLSVDKIKHQMQKDTKDALSTSHCSQPNTIEYEFAIEWCLLQSRLDFVLKSFYKKQGEELRRLMANLKSN